MGMKMLQDVIESSVKILRDELFTLSFLSFNPLDSIGWDL